MRHELARCTARVGEPKPVNNIIESRFQQLEKRFTGYTTLAQRRLTFVFGPVYLAISESL